MNNPDKHAAFNTAVTDDGGTPCRGMPRTRRSRATPSFSLFIADPDLLKALRPHVHKYLSDLFAAGASSGTGSAAGSWSGRAPGARRVRDQLDSVSQARSSPNRS